MDQAEFRRTDNAHGSVLVVAGEIDTAVADSFYEALLAAIQDAHSPAHVDMSDVTFSIRVGLRCWCERA